MLSAARLRALQEIARSVFVQESVAEYAVRLVLATRNPAAFGLPDLAGALAYGASPRATLGLVAAGRAWRCCADATTCCPADVTEVAADVLAHRLVLSFDALADGIDPRWIVSRVLAAVEPPRDRAGAGEPAVRSAGDEQRERTPAQRELLDEVTSAARRPPAAPSRTDDLPSARRPGARRLPRPDAGAGHASRPRRASTGPARTTSAGWTGLSPPAPPCRTSATRSPTTSSRPGCWSTPRRAWTSARPRPPSSS